jgi:hypothetical protein
VSDIFIAPGRATVVEELKIVFCRNVSDEYPQRTCREYLYISTAEKLQAKQEEQHDTWPD